MELQQSNVIVICICVKSFMTNDLFNPFAGFKAQSVQAHIARIHRPHSRIGVPVMGWSNREQNP